MNRVERARKTVDIPLMKFDFPNPMPLQVHLKDICDRDVAEKYYYSDEKLKGFISFDSPQGITDGIVRAGTLASISGHDYLKRVYGLNGVAPTIPTGSGGNNMPKVEVEE
ncbi:hypothetical protein [Selenomonas ruminantium]|uniref:hypothetical protein n=1 Tax=Selenomonas ruminantium TaxID=971 RepID=UPI0026EA90FC|nr:hypothetical protein [Selenomonas ruminantium]